jgi:hypothetical protein
MDKKKWTFMVYMAGDNNLSDAGDRDLEEMRAVGSSADVNVVVQFDRARDRGTTRYLVQPNGKNEETASLGMTDSGDPQVLIDFVKWAAPKYQADRYALVLWNHGGGWAPSEMDRVARSVGTRNYGRAEGAERSASTLGKTFFRTSLEKIFSLPTAEERAICSDDGSGHSLDTIELGNVLKQVQQTLGQKLDVLGMDACLMSNLEVAYQARPYVNYIVASEESEPNAGWPYTPVLKKLVESPDMTTADFATHIVEAYIKSYQDMGSSEPVTQAALDLAKVDAVAVPINSLAEALLALMPGASQEIWSSQRASTNFYYKTLWDIAYFCEKLGQLTQSDQVRQAAAAVGGALKPGSGNFMMVQSHDGAKVQNCGGLSIYLPYADLSRYYNDLAWVKDYPGWGKLLDKYLS